MTEEDTRMDNWKQFQGTELGGLLGRIYANDKPKISYPKPKTKARPPPERFIPGGAKAGAEDPRKVTRQKVNVAAPRLSGRSGSGYSDRIDADSERFGAGNYIPSRRGAAEIRAELDDMEMKKRHYRPAYVQPISSDKEKDRLAQICEYKGGKGLPVEMTGLVREAPFEREARLREADRIDKVRAKYRTSVPAAPAAPLPHAEVLRQQIAEEINERVDYMHDMRSLGKVDRTKERLLKAEVAQRVEELKRLGEDA